MGQVEISNEQTGVEVTPSLLEYLVKGAEVTVQAAGGSPLAEAGIILVDDSYMRELNRTYRGQDCSTDVLSFAMLEAGEGEPEVFGLEQDTELGDVFVSMESAVRQAAEFGHSLEREVVFLAVHGMLHLLGYDHLEEADRTLMREKEDEVMAMLDLRREL